jgi:acyl-CoA dehydrogenase
VTLDASVAEVRVQVRKFLDGELHAERFQPSCNSWLTGWDAEFSRRLARQGWLGMTWPERYGGHDRSTLERYAVTEELLAAGAPVAAHWFADRQVGPALLRHGTEEQRYRFLPAIASGNCFFAIGLSEPDTGSDLASVRTRADPDGTGWRLRGTKLWTSGAHRADVLLVLARTSPLTDGRRHDGLSQFIVARDSPGLSIRPVLNLTGEHHFNEVVMDDVLVAADQVLGTIGNGWAQVVGELAFERSGPERFLSTYPLLKELVAFAGQQVDPAGAAAIGALLARLWTLRKMSASVASQLAGGSDPAVAAAMVKDLGACFENDVIELAREVLGIEPDPASDDPLTRLVTTSVAEAPGFTLRGGTTEVLRGIVARAVGVR